VTWQRFALGGLTSLLALGCYVGLYPRLVAAGQAPPDVVGWALEFTCLGLLMASLVMAIMAPARRR
jgi:hypothetical protein